MADLPAPTADSPFGLAAALENLVVNDGDADSLGSTSTTVVQESSRPDQVLPDFTTSQRLHRLLQGIPAELVQLQTRIHDDWGGISKDEALKDLTRASQMINDLLEGFIKYVPLHPFKKLELDTGTDSETLPRRTSPQHDTPNRSLSAPPVATPTTEGSPLKSQLSPFLGFEEDYSPQNKPSTPISLALRRGSTGVSKPELAPVKIVIGPADEIASPPLRSALRRRHSEATDSDDDSIDFPDPNKKKSCVRFSPHLTVADFEKDEEPTKLLDSEDAVLEYDDPGVTYPSLFPPAFKYSIMLKDCGHLSPGKGPGGGMGGLGMSMGGRSDSLSPSYHPGGGGYGFGVHGYGGGASPNSPYSPGSSYGGASPYSPSASLYGGGQPASSIGGYGSSYGSSYGGSSYGNSPYNGPPSPYGGSQSPYGSAPPPSPYASSAGGQSPYAPSIGPPQSPYGPESGRVSPYSGSYGPSPGNSPYSPGNPPYGSSYGSSYAGSAYNQPYAEQPGSSYGSHSYGGQGNYSSQPPPDPNIRVTDIKIRDKSMLSITVKARTRSEANGLPNGKVWIKWVQGPKEAMSYASKDSEGEFDGDLSKPSILDPPVQEDKPKEPANSGPPSATGTLDSLSFLTSVLLGSSGQQANPEADKDMDRWICNIDLEDLFPHDFAGHHGKGSNQKTTSLWFSVRVEWEDGSTIEVDDNAGRLYSVDVIRTRSTPIKSAAGKFDRGEFRRSGKPRSVNPTTSMEASDDDDTDDSDDDKKSDDTKVEVKTSEAPT